MKKWSFLDIGFHSLVSN